MNIVSGRCDCCETKHSYGELKRHENCLFCPYAFQEGNSKLLILLVHIHVHISPVSFITKMVVTSWNQLLSNFVYI